MSSFLTRLAGVAIVGLSAVAPSQAQTYEQIVSQTIYQRQEVPAYRLMYETIHEDRQVTRSRPVWNTEQRIHRYTVAKPVTQTHTRMERYYVLKPVVQNETRTQRRLVTKPVTRTVMQDRSYVTNEPVTTMRTEYVDQGGFVDQQVFRPDAVRNRLRWLQGQYYTDPASGSQLYQRGGLYWVPTQGPGRYENQRTYVPNVVARQVPQTQMVQRVVNQQVPVNVTQYVNEWVDQQYTVPVQKWVRQEQERPVTFTTQTIQYEQREDPVEVQVCKWVNDTETVKVPRMVAKWVPTTATRLVPRTVTMRVPVDACGNYMYSPYIPRVAANSVQKPVTANRPVTEDEDNATSESRAPALPGGVVASEGEETNSAPPAASEAATTPPATTPPAAEPAATAPAEATPATDDRPRVRLVPVPEFNNGAADPPEA